MNDINKFQQKVNSWIDSHGGYWPPLSMLASITEELGELAREINHLEGHKPKKSTEIKAKIGEELGDLLFSVICMANFYKIDLTKELDAVINKYSSRDALRFKKKNKNS